MKIFTRLQISISEKVKSSPVWTGEYLVVQVTISEKINLHPSGRVKFARHEGESEERSAGLNLHLFGGVKIENAILERSGWLESSPVWRGEDSKHLHPED